MEQRAPASTSSAVTNAQSAEKHHEGRGAWVLTAYAVSGLAMLGVLAYYFSDFVTH
jgi:hypothetical protein